MTKKCQQFSSLNWNQITICMWYRAEKTDRQTMVKKPYPCDCNQRG